MMRLSWLTALCLAPALAAAQPLYDDDYPRLSPPGFDVREYNRPDDPAFSRSWSNRPALPRYYPSEAPNPLMPANPYMLPFEEPPPRIERPRPRSSGPLVPPRSKAPPEPQASAPQAATPPRSRLPQGPTMIPPHIVLMRLAGPWRMNGSEGFTRIVIGRTTPREDSMRLFVQWIATDSAADRFQLVESIELAEMRNWRITLDEPSLTVRDGENTVILEAVAPVTGARRTYRLSMGNPGVASLTAP